MDEIDRKILHELQLDGRITMTELASRLPLSVSRCQRRVRELEASGVIRGYRADVDPDRVGFAFSAFVFITMRQEDQATRDEFEDRVASIPEVISAQRLFGDPDFLVVVVAADLEAYRRVYDERLTALPGVERLTSTLVMKEIVSARSLPLIPAASSTPQSREQAQIVVGEPPG